MILSDTLKNNNIVQYRLYNHDYLQDPNTWDSNLPNDLKICKSTSHHSFLGVTITLFNHVTKVGPQFLLPRTGTKFGWWGVRLKCSAYNAVTIDRAGKGIVVPTLPVISDFRSLKM